MDKKVLFKLVFIIIWLIYVIRIFVSEASGFNKFGQIVGFCLFLLLIYYLLFKFKSVKRFFRKLRIKISGREFSVDF